MDNILPLILETLSTKPESEETEKNILKELRAKLKNKKLESKNLKKKFEEAIVIGEELGILRLINENIQMPFSLINKKKKEEKEKEEPQPSRSKSVPAKTSKKDELATTDKERRGRSRRGSRRGGKSRSRSQSRSQSHGGRSRSSRRRRRSRR